MAKKGGQVQLQAELNNEEDWRKFLDREGLITVVDVYSDWCGPCSAMCANLKKLKLEVGGDNMHLAVAKSDNIACLKRFRDKSEPTWMFIAGRKMVNLLFGANAPLLIRVITEELKKEQAVREGLCAREEMEITALSPIEKERLEAQEKYRLEQEAIDVAAEAEALHATRVRIAEAILEGLPLVGAILVFPKAKDVASTVLKDIWDPYGLKVSTTDKAFLGEKHFEELLYFSQTTFSELQKNLDPAPCMAYLIKHKDDNIEVDFDDLVLQAVYGESKCPPGSEGCSAEKLRCSLRYPEAAEEGDDHVEEGVIDGIWVPLDRLSRAFALKILFPSTTAQHIPPNTEPAPPYVALSFDAFKRTDVMALLQEFPEDVMRFGFFTEENPETAKLIAKNVTQFEKKLAESTTYGEKMVLQLSRKHEKAVVAFAQLGPSYVSPNTVEGERDCAKFFPKGYDEPEVQVALVVKKKRRRGRRGAAAPPPSPAGVPPVEKAAPEGVPRPEEIQEGYEGEHVEEELGEGEAEEGEEGEDGDEVDELELGEGEDGEVDPEEADKATSPMTQVGSLAEP